MTHVRWMITDDLRAVLDIECKCFEFPWSVRDFRTCLSNRNTIGMVAEDADNKIVGFMIYELHPNRLHIVNFAVHPERQRQGVGKRMVHKLIGKLSIDRRNRIMLEIRETNINALLFFKSFGFKAIQVLKNFYDDTDEDAYLMQLRHVATEEELIRLGKLTRVCR